MNTKCSTFQGSFPIPSGTVFEAEGEEREQLE